MMRPPERPQFAELLATLVRHHVDFVVVGGAAAVLAGVWQATDDLDVVPSLDRGNLERLLAALVELEAIYADPAGRTIRPDLDKLAGSRMSLLRTRLGRLDLIRSIGHDRDYGALLDRSSLVALDGTPVRTLDLETLIEAKEVAGRDKDREHLLRLREALRLKRLMQKPPEAER